MPLEYSEFLIFLLCIVLVAVIIFAFTMGTLVRGNLSFRLKSKPKAKHVEPKEKPTVTKPVPPNPCLLAAQGGYVGILRKEWKGKGEYPPSCYPSSQNPKGCDYFLECVGAKGKK